MHTTPIKDLFQSNLQNNSELPTKQKQVLKAALELFAAQGVDNTSTKQIAQLANVSEGTVYKRFKTKEQLFTAVLHPIIAIIPQVAQEFRQVLINTEFTNLTDLLQTITLDRFDFAQANQQELRVIIREALNQQELVLTIMTNVKREVLPTLYQQFDQLKEQHQLIAWDNDRIFSYMLSTLIGSLVPTILLNQPRNNKVVAAQLIEFLNRGLTPS
ncbi:TetR/AcrR family transcriptional regulator [Lentilactobacillus kribbianus]|uniref:TetR/AcrR family transcriptional regulator n=1 Tax=Lentilactobacillus kribbianus TaxID=2729622 RepID=UPI001556AC92|nr:TetR/AcrR family transcriptional regulator [Lentilactobacillus kribbianus]